MSHGLCTLLVSTKASGQHGLHTTSSMIHQDCDLYRSKRRAVLPQEPIATYSSASWILFIKFRSFGRIWCFWIYHTQCVWTLRHGVTLAMHQYTLAYAQNVTPSNRLSCVFSELCVLNPLNLRFALLALSPSSNSYPPPLSK